MADDAEPPVAGHEAHTLGLFLSSFPNGFSIYYDDCQGVKWGSAAYILNARNINDNNIVTLKLYRRIYNDYRLALGAIRDAKYLQQLVHPNILRMTNICGMKSIVFTDVFLELERMDHDLSVLIAQPEIYFSTVDQSRNRFMLHILSGLAYIHSANLVHRNIQPSNILYQAATKTFKISDFHTARRINTDEIGKLTGTVVTTGYSAPELVLNPKSVTSSIDIYSAGIIFIEILVLGSPLFDSKSGMLHIEQILRKTGRPREEDLIDVTSAASRVWIGKISPEYPHRPWSQIYPDYSDAAKSLMDGMLQFARSRRLTAAQALENDYVKSAQDEGWIQMNYDGPPVQDYSGSMSIPTITGILRKSITLDISTELDTDQNMAFSDF